MPSMNYGKALARRRHAGRPGSIEHDCPCGFAVARQWNDLGDKPLRGLGTVAPPAIRTRPHHVVAVHEQRGLLDLSHAALPLLSCTRLPRFAPARDARPTEIGCSVVADPRSVPTAAALVLPAKTARAGLVAAQLALERRRLLLTEPAMAEAATAPVRRSGRMMSACPRREGRSSTSQSRIRCNRSISSPDSNRVSFLRGFFLIPRVGLVSVWPAATAEFMIWPSNWSTLFAPPAAVRL